MDCPVKVVSKLILTTDSNGKPVITALNQRINLTECAVHDGRYESPERVIGWLRWALKPEDRKNFRFKFDPVRRKIVITIPKHGLLVWPRNLTKLGDFCGFRSDIVTSGNHASSFDPINSLEQINLLTDIIDPQPAGDRLLPSLRSVPFRYNKKYLYYRFKKPCYFPLIKSPLDSIRIAVADGSGEAVALQKGPIIVSLEIL